MSCVTTTEIIKNGKSVCIIKSKDDAFVTHIKGDEQCIADLRGRPSFMETVFGTLFMKTDINVGSRD